MRLLDPAEAAALVPDGKSVVIGGSAGIGVADTLLEAIAARFKATGHPRDLTLIHTTGVGDFATKGMGHLALPGLAKRVIGGNYGPQPLFMQLITANQVEAYNFPQGVMAQMFRAVAAKQPGVVTHVGLHTYMDARQTGGKMNAAATEDLVELVQLGGREWLFYKAFPTDVAILRGTTADEDGNVSLEHEAASLEGLSIAQAVHNAGGTVICQVKRLARRGQLHPQMVRIPGVLIDAFVLVPDQPQTFGTHYDASMSGEVPRPVSTLVPDALTERRVIARRAAMELRRGVVVNLGVGMATGIPNVAAEEGIEDFLTLTVESGIVGGIPGSGLNFGTAYNPARHHGPALSVRLLPGRRARYRFSLLRAGRRRGERQRHEIRQPGGWLRRLHRHLAERQAAGLRRHARGRSKVCRRGGTAQRSRAKARSANSSPKSNRSASTPISRASGARK